MKLNDLCFCSAAFFVFAGIPVGLSLIMLYTRFL